MTAPIDASDRSGDPPGQPPLDGRTARALRTRDAIVDACIALVESGDLRPTAPRIADRAGVSVRSVFQHFDDLESLFARVADRVVENLGHLVEPIEPTLPLDERIEQFVAQRRRVLEALTPIRRAATVHAPFSRELTQRLQLGHLAMRVEIKSVFTTEIARLPNDERRPFIDVLDTVASWASWHNLRTLNGRSPDEAQAVLRRMVQMALASVAARS
ncbi:MAG: TetR/AcrR family transcriptional regulator [Actinobacteria bacterium]|nr:TetR/AcrR family transcriptional regulator [Actinomycetota bacterium]